MRLVRASVISVVVSGAVTFGWLASPGGSAPALAQTGGKGAPTGITADNEHVARAGYEKGRAAEAAGDWQQAYTEYRAAVALHPAPQYEAALGKAALELAKHREAAQVLQRVLDDPATAKSLSAAAMDEVKKNHAAALLKVGRLKVEGPEGAQLWVDGTLVGTLPLKEEPFADAGERDIEARRDGTVLARVRASVTAGKSEAVKLVEGEVFSPAPTAPAVAPPPAPSVTATATGAPTSTGAAPAPTATFTPVGGGPPPDKGGPSWAGVLALGGVAVAAAAVGTGLWIASDGKAAEAASGLSQFESAHGKGSPYCLNQGSDPLCKGIQDSLTAQDALQSGAAAAWIGGGVAAVGAVTIWLITRRERPKTGVRAMPVASPGQAGLVLRGSF